jgi:SpoVK/Ycf46/Vps4 family AAA+-type ATPase
VGSSESNIRNCIATCEAIAPCILWIDEIEKGLSGSSSSGQTDGGTTSRVFGSLLTWMQEKVSPVFVIATANDISSLPPELLRKGRFDEIFFVDLPTFDERKDIFDIHLERLGWTVEGMDKDVLSQSTEGFSGAEIEQVIISARYEALNTDESLNQKYLLKAISETVPLSKTMNDKLVTLRTWAKHRARQASSTKSDAPSDQFKVRANQLEYICN